MATKKATEEQSPREQFRDALGAYALSQQELGVANYRAEEVRRLGGIPSAGDVGARQTVASKAWARVMKFAPKK